MTSNTRSRYLIAGLVMGGLWWFNRDTPLLDHALQMLAMMTVLTVFQIVLRRHRGQPTAYGRLIGAKLLLLGFAVSAQWLLSPLTPRASLIVAGVLAVLATALGPRLEEGQRGRRPAPSAAQHTTQ